MGGIEREKGIKRGNGEKAWENKRYWSWKKDEWGKKVDGERERMEPKQHNKKSRVKRGRNQPGSSAFQCESEKSSEQHEKSILEAWTPQVKEKDEDGSFLLAGRLCAPRWVAETSRTWG